MVAAGLTVLGKLVSGPKIYISWPLTLAAFLQLITALVRPNLAGAAFQPACWSCAPSAGRPRKGGAGHDCPSLIMSSWNSLIEWLSGLWAWPISSGRLRSSERIDFTGSANLHNPLARLYALHEPRPRAVEGFQQMLLAAVPDSDPNEARRNGRSENKVQKILVFADKDVAFRLRIPEYLSVGSLR